jgi:organic radical activating enzyme
MTGGEPLIQQDEWVLLMKKLLNINSNYRFEVETNGTLIPSAKFEQLVDQFNVSPKLSNSGVNERIRKKDEILLRFSKLDKSVFKFVVDTVEDLEEVNTLVNDLNLPGKRVFLMPQGTTETELNKKAGWVVEACMNHGYCYSDRLHIRLFGNKRGV